MFTPLETGTIALLLLGLAMVVSPRARALLTARVLPGSIVLWGLGLYVLLRVVGKG